MEDQEKDWRALCSAAAQEPDSEKLVSLISQILEILEERDQVVPRSSSV